MNVLKAQITTFGNLCDQTSVGHRRSLWLWRVQQREDALRRRFARRPRMILEGKLAQRQEELWSQQQDRQRAVEGDQPVHQAQADLHGDKRCRRDGGPFERERGLEGCAQHLHRRAAKALADLRDDLGLLLAAPKELQGSQALQHVEEVRAHPAQLFKPALAQLFRARPDDGEQEDE